MQRLTEVRLGSRTSSNKIAYGYDRWGNRTSSATKGTVTNFMACSTDCGVDATTNRISNWRYDAAGNPIGISTSTLQWDGAGRLESIDSGSTASYSYDHLGRRILKRAPSDNTQYFYDVTGKVLWEFDPDGTGDRQKMVRAYFNGRLFTSTGDAAAGSHTVYTDHLGTPRLKLHVMTAASEARDDYYPFGQQVNTVVDAAHDRRFTGQERDAESGLDYFGARYYHSVAGRFLSVDPVLDSADPTNPQSWNRYAYTFNNPLKYVDKTGEIVETAWDLLNVALGVASLIDNVSAGHYGWAAVDALGVAVDAVAAAVPIVPGGAGAVIKGARLLNKVDNTADSVFATRRQAFNDAKRRNDIPTSQQPDEVIKPRTPKGRDLDNTRNVRLYKFKNSKGQEIYIREDRVVKYKDGGSQGPHFNSGPDPKRLRKHHYWREKRKSKPFQ